MNTASASSVRREIIALLERLQLVSAANAVRGLSSRASPRVAWNNLKWRMRGAPDGLPLPPTRLIYLVSNRYDSDWFLTSGKAGYECILDVLNANRIDLGELASICDFGCGCGRVTRHFHRNTEVAVWGTDYNGQGVKWASQHLDFAQFGTNQLAPPLDYPDAKFGLIWAFSVFTHLSLELHHQWFDELCRVVRPGGYLLISTHGEYYRASLTKAEQASFDAGELVVRMAERSGANLCNAFCSEAFVRNSLVRGAQVVDYIPRGARGNPKQDLYLIRVG